MHHNLAGKIEANCVGMFKLHFVYFNYKIQKEYPGFDIKPKGCTEVISWWACLCNDV